MILTFPDFETLQLALTSGAIPPAVSRTAAAVGVDAEGRPCVEPSVSRARAGVTELRGRGVDTARTAEAALAEQVFCWAQLLPLRRGEPATTRPEQSAVLFDLPVEQLGSVATEILRLGNDRQSF